jgi:hypothetical protein
MFINETVFILGAGASWHYGYPTGEELVEKVREKAGLFHGYCSKIVQQNNATAIAQIPSFLSRNAPGTIPDGLTGMQRLWEAGRDEADKLVQRLTAVDPLVIDYFLGHNPDLQDIGKFMIAWVLLEREAMYESEKFNVNRREALQRSTEPSDRLKLAKPEIWPHFKDNWYRFLIHKLAVGCSKSSDLLQKNDVRFVTFNYDVSLEYRLFQGLSAISLFEGNDVIRAFFKVGRVLHMYGRIREAPFGEPPPFDREISSGKLIPLERHDPIRYWNANKSLFDTVYNASTGIRTIAPNEKISNEEVEAAASAIRDAACVYILGYGFDPANNELLDLRSAIAENQFTRRNILFTNFDDGGVVNKRANRVFPGVTDKLLLAGPQVAAGGSIYIEKSIRDVYKTLSLDLEAPEESPIQTR